MILSHNETKRLIDLVLTYSREESRVRLHHELSQVGYHEAEFCAGVSAHGRGMFYTSEQWFDFLSKVPNRLFRDEHWLMNKLSPLQRQQLGLE